MKGGYYRPMYLHASRPASTRTGNIVAWKHVIVGQSIITGTAFET